MTFKSNEVAQLWLRLWPTDESRCICSARNATNRVSAATLLGMNSPRCGHTLALKRNKTNLRKNSKNPRWPPICPMPLAGPGLTVLQIYGARAPPRQSAMRSAASRSLSNASQVSMLMRQSEGQGRQITATAFSHCLQETISIWLR